MKHLAAYSAAHSAAHSIDRLREPSAAPGEHPCIVAGCGDRRVPAKYLMCRRHWNGLGRRERAEFIDLCFELGIAAVLGAGPAGIDAIARRLGRHAEELCALAQRGSA